MNEQSVNFVRDVARRNSIGSRESSYTKLFWHKMEIEPFVSNYQLSFPPIHCAAPLGKSAVSVRGFVGCRGEQRWGGKGKKAPRPTMRPLDQIACVHFDFRPAISFVRPFESISVNERTKQYLWHIHVSYCALSRPLYVEALYYDRDIVFCLVYWRT